MPDRKLSWSFNSSISLLIYRFVATVAAFHLHHPSHSRRPTTEAAVNARYGVVCSGGMKGSRLCVLAPIFNDLMEGDAL